MLAHTKQTVGISPYTGHLLKKLISKITSRSPEDKSLSIPSTGDALCSTLARICYPDPITPLSVYTSAIASSQHVG